MGKGLVRMILSPREAENGGGEGDTHTGTKFVPLTPAKPEATSTPGLFIGLAKIFLFFFTGLGKDSFTYVSYKYSLSIYHSIESWTYRSLGAQRHNGAPCLGGGDICESTHCGRREESHRKKQG